MSSLKPDSSHLRVSILYNTIEKVAQFSGRELSATAIVGRPYCGVRTAVPAFMVTIVMTKKDRMKTITIERVDKQNNSNNNAQR